MHNDQQDVCRKGTLRMHNAQQDEPSTNGAKLQCIAKIYMYNY